MNKQTDRMRRGAAAIATVLAAAGLWLAPGGAARAVVEPVDRVAAVVNTDVITLGELDARMRTVEMQLRRQNVQIPPTEVLRSQVLERMIVDRAQVQLAREQGVRIDDSQVDRAVASVAAQNSLSVQDLRSRLEQDGISFAAFRDSLRADMVIARLREREVDQRVQISEADIDAFLREQRDPAASHVEYNLAHILIRIPEGASADQIAAQRAKAEGLLQQIESGAEFGRLAVSFSDSPEGISGGGLGWRDADRLPQLFVQAVSALQPGQTSGLIRSPNGFHILKLLDKRVAGDSALPGGPVLQTHARHILIRQTELVSEAEALRRLREIRERIEQKTATFADMARQYSVDGSASNGGDLGWIYPGDTVPEFERAMNALKPGELSEPVRTPFGWHLIEVEARRNDEASPDRLRMLARQSLRERRADEAYQDWLRQLRDRTYVEYKLDQ
ncbi:MAG: peptidylprolyl isomerase [Burkholderiaceae bacterium]